MAASWLLTSYYIYDKLAWLFVQGACSSVGQSSGLIIHWSSVQARSGLPYEYKIGSAGSSGDRATAS